MTHIIREIATRHSWPEKAVSYKVYYLNLQHEQSAPLGILTPGGRADELTRGDTIWEARIDGLPLKWYLTYEHGHFPYAPRTPVSYGGKQYRVVRIGRTWFDLTSQNADENGI